uniref:Uncharacterized protein n=1 Tax=Romanomermis culicivorax TaxID=13658 RepID=A0A915JQV2_ROMCU
MCTRFRLLSSFWQTMLYVLDIRIPPEGLRFFPVLGVFLSPGQDGHTQRVGQLNPAWSHLPELANGENCLSTNNFIHHLHRLFFKRQNSMVEALYNDFDDSTDFCHFSIYKLCSSQNKLKNGAKRVSGQKKCNHFTANS